ncbi:unnamed protein product [Mytilus coruscus]|uniref:Uncharacterized protein n=1 Tax=Mytilus coruscus TaxID=42192 RepID=A0A6J7ZWZ0_MYTCO|nr:unnamed protein product [Mytilus coruscus]
MDSQHGNGDNTDPRKRTLTERGLDLYRANVNTHSKKIELVQTENTKTEESLQVYEEHKIEDAKYKNILERALQQMKVSDKDEKESKFTHRSEAHSRTSSNSSSVAIRKRAKAEAAQAKLEFAMKEADLQKQKAYIEEQEKVASAKTFTKKAELEAELELLNYKKEAAAATAEADALEYDQNVCGSKKSDLLSKTVYERTNRYVEQQVLQVKDGKLTSDDNIVPCDPFVNQTSGDAVHKHSHMPTPKPSRPKYDVPSTQLNPADQGTRSIAADKVNSSLWILGPKEFISKCEHQAAYSETLYPLIEPTDDKELRPLQRVNVLKTSVDFQTALGSERFERFSEWIRLVESISFLKKVAKYRTAAVTGDTSSKYVETYKEAELFIIKVVQNEVYQTEIDNIRQSLRLPKNSTLVSLNPFLDSRGVLCVGGRLNKANIELHEKNPIIIPVRDIADQSYKDVSSLSRDFSDFKKGKGSDDANDKLTELQANVDKSLRKLEQLGTRIDKVVDQFGNMTKNQIIKMQGIAAENTKELVSLRRGYSALEKGMKGLDELTDLKNKENSNQQSLNQLSNSMKNIKNTGDTYIRWGRTSCPSGGTKLVYSGYIGGGYYMHPGGPARPICLPSQPNFLRTSGGTGAFVYGTEFQSGFFGPKAEYQDVPCAVCEVQQGSKKIMIPGRYNCYPDWKREYYGNLAAGYAKNKNHASAYICIDLRPEYIHGGSGRSNKANFLHEVIVRCGSLPCPPYHEGYPLPCVVCSK